MVTRNSLLEEVLYLGFKILYMRMDWTCKDPWPLGGKECWLCFLATGEGLTTLSGGGDCQTSLESFRVF